MRQILLFIITLGMILFSGCSDSDKAVIGMAKGESYIVKKGDRLIPGSTDTKIKVRHYYDDDIKSVVLVSGSAILISANVEETEDEISRQGNSSTIVEVLTNQEEEPVNSVVLASSLIVQDSDNNKPVILEQEEPIVIVSIQKDSDNDGVPNFKDECADTPTNYNVYDNGCTSSFTINFTKRSTKIAIGNKELSKFVEFMKSNPSYTATIIGHTSRTVVSGDAYNMKLSLKRANMFKDKIVNRGILETKLVTIGKGFHYPIADNATEEGRYQNRRIEILINP